VLLPDHCLAVFDLTQEVSPQLRRVGQALLLLQPNRIRVEQKKFHRRNFGLYLRALDAEKDLAHLGYRKIGEVLDPKNKRPAQRYKELLDAAHELQNRITQIFAAR
jgi:hypothetical protein